MHTHTHTHESGLQCMGMSQRVGHSWACTLTHRAECTHTHTLNSSPCPVTFHPYVVSLNSTSHAWVTGMSWLPPNYIIFLLVLWLSSQSCLTLMLPTYILLFLLWFSRQVISDSSRPHGLQHARPPCPCQLPEFAQTHVHWVGNVIQSSHPLSSPSPPAFNLSCIRVFSNESVLHIRWPKYWSFSFNITPYNEYSGLISFSMDWLNLLAVQGTLKSLLQHHSSKASIQHSAFFIVQLSHPYMTTGKTIALTRWTFVGKVMSLLFNMLSKLVIAFLPRSKHLSISWLQLPYAMILEHPKKRKIKKVKKDKEGLLSLFTFSLIVKL